MRNGFEIVTRKKSDRENVFYKRSIRPVSFSWSKERICG